MNVEDDTWLITESLVTSNYIFYSFDDSWTSDMQKFCHNNFRDMQSKTRMCECNYLYLLQPQADHGIR